MDRSLATLLRSLQTSRSFEDAERLLPVATGLLYRLSNPLNVTLLASQLLISPFLFPTPVNLASCRNIFSVFHTAAVSFVDNEGKEDFQGARSNLSRTAWTEAVVHGADDKSPRWRHILLLGGLLHGFEGHSEPRLPHQLRDKLENALIMAANLALNEKDIREPNNQFCIAFVLNHTFPLISDRYRDQLNYDLLLPELVEATYFSREGLEHGYWLGTIDADVRQVSNTRFTWSSKSQSFQRLQQLQTRGLASSLGPLSRLIAHSIDFVKDTDLIARVVIRISEFSRNLALSWRQNKLSEIEVSEEKDFLDEETLRTTLPLLLQVLRNSLFSIVICLRAVMGRLLINKHLSSTTQAPTLAVRCLHILRDSYFISHRFGQGASSQYQFVNYTSIDILNQYPLQAESFLAAIKPNEPGKIPLHPLDRLQDLFFLNIAEHFTLSLRPEANEELLVSAAMPYTTIHGDPRMSEIYEAAHSVLLAVFAAPQNSEVAAKHVPFYIETLMQSFPNILSPRQFRLAVKSIVQITGSHTPLTMSMPLLQPIVLDMLRQRSLVSSETIIPSPETALESQPALSEKSTIVLAIIDSLSFLPLDSLSPWLHITAESIHRIDDPAQRADCQRRFWDVLSNHDMDVARAAECVSWWTSRGGREMTLYGEHPAEIDDFTMSGGLQIESKM